MKTRTVTARAQQLAGWGRYGLVLAGLVGLVPAAAAQSGFGSPTTYAGGGTNPLGVAIGDLNGDGRPDLVLANQGTSTVSVLLGQAAPLGTYGGATTYTIPGSGTSNAPAPTGVALGDVNGDGRLDIVTGNQSGTVGVLLGSATAPGTFAAAVGYGSGGTSSVGVALSDVNGDSRPDIVVANNGTNTVGVLLGSATTAGTFGPASTYACTKPNLLALGDINGDGRPDIVAGNETGGTVSVLTGQAAGTFGAAASYASGGTGPIGVALGDVNGDSRRDIVVTNYQSHTVAVLLNTYVVLATAPAQAAPEVSVYPNPAHEAFTVQLPAAAGAGTVQAELLNTMGQVVRRQQAWLPAGGAGLAVDAAGLAPGLYLVRLQVGATALTRSLVLH